MYPQTVFEEISTETTSLLTSGLRRHPYQGRAHGRSRREGTLPGMAGHAVHA